MTVRHLLRLAGPPSPRARLVCFPYAGAGAAVFRRWARQFDADIELIAVQLPGREDLFEETPLRDMPLIGKAVSTALSSLIADKVPTALFGYCSGAFAALETAKQLTRGGVPPRLLVACSQVAPQAAAGNAGVHALPAGDLKQFLRSLGGTAAVVTSNDELWEVVEAAVRADYEAAETYVAGDNPGVDCEILVLHGASDERVTRPGIEAWAAVTTGRTVIRQLPGSHFLLDSSGTEIRREIVGCLLTPEAEPAA